MRPGRENVIPEPAGHAITTAIGDVSMVHRVPALSPPCPGASSAPVVGGVMHEGIGEITSEDSEKKRARCPEPANCESGQEQQRGKERGAQDGGSGNQRGGAQMVPLVPPGERRDAVQYKAMDQVFEERPTREPQQHERCTRDCVASRRGEDDPS